MRLHFLGTGTSFGVPVIGCDCKVCTSDEPRNRRYRHSLALEAEGGTLLVDASPELRLQLLRAGIRHVDAVYVSHLHADHIHGIDDLRIFSLRSKGPLPVYVAREQADVLKGRFDYIFDETVRRSPGTSAPEIDLRTFDAGDRLQVAGIELRPLAFPHGRMRSYGFRAGSLGVIVDGKRVTPEAQRVLAGVDVLVINALWWGNPHPTHFNVEEAVEAARGLGARKTYLTHLTHRLDYHDLLGRLPQNVMPAYDGLVIEVDRVA